MTSLVRTYVASPFMSKDPEEVRQNIIYAQLCLLDCFSRNEAGYASHLLYTQLFIETTVLRELGLRAGDAWREGAQVIALYVDLGISEGMARAEAKAGPKQRVEQRSLSIAQLSPGATPTEWRAVLAGRDVQYFQELIRK